MGGKGRKGKGYYLKYEDQRTSTLKGFLFAAGRLGLRLAQTRPQKRILGLLFLFWGIIEVQLLSIDKFLLDFSAGLELIFLVPGLAFAVVMVRSTGGVGLTAFFIAQTRGFAILAVGVPLS